MTSVSRPATSPSSMLPEDAPNFNYTEFLRDITKVGPYQIIPELCSFCPASRVQVRIFVYRRSGFEKSIGSITKKYSNAPRNTSTIRRSSTMRPFTPRAILAAKSGSQVHGDHLHCNGGMRTCFMVLTTPIFNNSLGPVVRKCNCRRCIAIEGDVGRIHRP
jgi:hypothetical protein